MMRLRQGLKSMFLDELEDQLMRRLFCFETLLHPDEEIFSAFSRDPESDREQLKWLGFIHSV